MRARSLLLSGTACALFMSGTPASASETTSFTYDALGRLIATNRTGGPSNGVNMATCFDSAGNRIRYDTATAAPAACPVVPPTPTPLPTPSFSIDNAAAVAEGGTLVFTVTRIGAASVTYSVNYSSTGGTATSGSDFIATAGTLTFLPSETSKTVTVATIDDGAVESTEAMKVVLSSPSGGATITTAQGIGTITDNDVAPSFAIGNATVTEGGTLAYPVTRTGTVSINYAVNYATASGTGLSGSDFTPASGTLTFLPTETTKFVNVVTIDDSVVESSETVLVDLSSPTGGATVTTSQGTGTITDNDVPSTNFPPVTVNDTFSVSCHGLGSVNLTANDSDPENNVPLVLQSISRTIGDATASIVNGSTVEIYTNDRGQTIFAYVVADSLGASSSGQLTVTATGNINYCSGGGNN